MRRLLNMTQTTKPTRRKRGLVIGIVSLLVFFIGIIGFAVDAKLYTSTNNELYVKLSYLWIAIFALGFIGMASAIVLSIIDNKERISNYYHKINNIYSISLRFKYFTTLLA